MFRAGSASRPKVELVEVGPSSRYRGFWFSKLLFLDIIYPDGASWLQRTISDASRETKIVSAFYGGFPAGCAILKKKYRNDWKICTFYIDRNFRRTGVSSSVLVGVVEMAAGFGAEKLCVTHSEEVLGHFSRFLSPLGFSESGKLIGRYRYDAVEVVSELRIY